MTMLPGAPGFLVIEHTLATPLAYLRFAGDPNAFGWYVIERRSPCIVNVRGPFASEAAAREAGRLTGAAWAEAAAARRARLAARSASGQG